MTVFCNRFSAEDFCFDADGVNDQSKCVVVIKFKIPKKEQINFTKETGDSNFYINKENEPNISYYSPAYFIINHKNSDLQQKLLSMHFKLGVNNLLDDAKLVFLTEFGSFDWINTNIRWNDLTANSITAIVCLSHNQNDFHRHTSDKKMNWKKTLYGRYCILESETKRLIHTDDFVTEQFLTNLTSDFSKYIFLPKTKQSCAFPDYSLALFEFQIRNLGEYTGLQPHSKEFDTKQYWCSLGETFDPLMTVNGEPKWKIFLESSWPEKIDNVRAWFNVSIKCDIATKHEPILLKFGKSRFKNNVSQYALIINDEIVATKDSNKSNKQQEY